MATLVNSPKVNQSKVKNMVSTVLKMGSEDPDKKLMLQTAKLVAFQLFAGLKNLKQEETRQIVKSVYSEVI